MHGWMTEAGHPGSLLPIRIHNESPERAQTSFPGCEHFRQNRGALEFFRVTPVNDHFIAGFERGLEYTPWLPGCALRFPGIRPPRRRAWPAREKRGDSEAPRRKLAKFSDSLTNSPP
jgi:hypothetical protein